MKKKIKDIDFNKYLDKIKNIDFNDFLNKLKSLKLDDVKKLLLDYWNRIITYILIVSLFLLLFFSVIFSIKTYNNYLKVQKNTMQIELITNASIEKLIKDNKLRDLNTVSITYYLLLNNKYPSKSELYKLEKNIKYILSNIKLKGNISALSKLVDFPDISKSYSKKVKDYKLLAKVVHNLYVYELSLIYNKAKELEKKYNNMYNNTQAPYNYFLKYIYFPEQGIWKDKFSWKINIDIFWWNYLKKAKYLDINLIAYWSNYFSKAYKWLLYWWDENIISSIKVWKFSQTSNKAKSALIKLPINVKFWVINDKSFYWLISKLTSSNLKNTMNIYKFTYLLWNNIVYNVNNKILDNINNNSNFWEKYIDSILSQCLFWNRYYELWCENLFWWCKTKGCFLKNSKLFDKKTLFSSWFNNTYKKLYKKLSDNYNIDSSFLAKYYKQEYYNINDINKLIWANLYNCIFDDKGYCQDLFWYKNSIIKKTIVDFIWNKYCTIDNIMSNDSCKAVFIRKFDTNYFIWYTLVWDLSKYSNYSLKDRLKDIYKNISWFISLWKFTFRKINNILYSNNGISDIKYNADISLYIYYKWIINKYVNNIL